MASLAEYAGWLFGWLLRNSAHAAVLAGVVWAMERTVCRRLPPRWRYGLWLLVVARLILPIAPGSPLSLFNLVDFLPAPVAGFLVQFLGLPSPFPIAMPGALPMHPLADTPPWFVLALAMWVPGALLLAFCLLRDHERLKLALGGGLVTDQQILDLLLQSKAVMGVRRSVELVESSRISSPAITGWWRPRILIPVGLLERLSRDETRFLFLHELAHVKRADIALNWILAVVQVLHWFNPVVWLALRRLLSVREQVCDDLVLRRCFFGAAREYGLTLIRLLEECAPHRLLPAYAGVLDDVPSLRQRVRSIRDFTIVDERPWSYAVLTVVVAVAGLTDRTRQNAFSPASAMVMDVPGKSRPPSRVFHPRIPDAQVSNPGPGNLRRASGHEPLGRRFAGPLREAAPPSVRPPGLSAPALTANPTPGGGDGRIVYPAAPQGWVSGQGSAPQRPVGYTRSLPPVNQRGSILHPVQEGWMSTVMIQPPRSPRADWAGALDRGAGQTRPGVLRPAS